MSRRGGQLTRVTLRLGLLLGGIVAGWSAYSAVSADAAYAADAPHAVTVNGTADLPRISRTPDLRLTETTQSAETSVRFPSASGDGGTVTTADRSRVSTGSRAAWGSRPDRPTTSSPRHRTEKAAPDRPDRPAARTPARTGSGTEPTGSRVPATPTAHVGRPVAKPGTGPVPEPGRPGTGTTRPVDSHVPKPEAKDDAHALPGPKEAAKTPSRDPGKSRAEPTLIARTARGLTPAVPVIVGLLAVPHRHAKAGDWSPPQAGGATTGRAPDPTRPDAEPAPGAPAPHPGSVGTSQAGHGDAADASGAAWTPPVALAQPCRPDRAGDLPSRSPRPGTRPA